MREAFRGTRALCATFWHNFPRPCRGARGEKASGYHGFRSFACGELAPPVATILGPVGAESGAGKLLGGESGAASLSGRNANALVSTRFAAGGVAIGGPSFDAGDAMQSNVGNGIVATRAPGAVILIRLMVGLVFLSEGLQKFMVPALGVERFAKIGFSSPEGLAYFVACFEVVCGALIVAGLFTRLAAIPLVIIMLTALTTTKVPILLGHDLWGFHVRTLSEYGFRMMLHEARTDWSMLLGSLFLLIVGGGRLSWDAAIMRRRGGEDSSRRSKVESRRSTMSPDPRRS
jgi:putative oxidoreductase